MIRSLYAVIRSNFICCLIWESINGIILVVYTFMSVNKSKERKKCHCWTIKLDDNWRRFRVNAMVTIVYPCCWIYHKWNREIENLMSTFGFDIVPRQKWDISFDVGIIQIHLLTIVATDLLFHNKWAFHILHVKYKPFEKFAIVKAVKWVVLIH